MPATSLAVNHLFTVTALTVANPPIMNGPQGSRVIVGVTGGTFEGERLKGTVVANPGGDWVTLRPDGSARLDVRLLLKTHDDALILMTYSGILALKEGVRVLRTAPQFETGDERYTWLNNLQAVATGQPGQGSVTYDVYEFL